MKHSDANVQTKPARSRWLFTSRLGLVLLFAGVITIPPAIAQPGDPQSTAVRDRARPDYDPAGIRVGSFFLYPSIDLGVEYEDNVFATTNNKQSDAILTVAPRVAMQSDWSRHALSLEASGRLGFFTDLTTEDYQDARLGLSGRLDVGRNSWVQFRVAGNRRHEDRGSPDDAGGLKPTIFYTVNPEVRLHIGLNRLFIQLATEVDVVDFKDTLAAGGVIINEDDRDRVVWTGRVKLGMRVSEGLRAFVEGSYNVRDYDDLVDDAGRMRDSDGFGISAGVNVVLTGTLTAEAFLGYRRQSFDELAFETIKGVTGGLDLIWTPTQLTTVTLGGERRIDETTQAGVSGVFATEFSLRVDHELLRQLIVTAQGSVFDRDFRGNGRNDTGWRAGVRATYLLNRNLNLDVGYEYRKRDSNFALETFDLNKAHLRLRVQL